MEDEQEIPVVQVLIISLLMILFVLMFYANSVLG